MTTLKCMQPQTASTITILRDVNSKTTTEPGSMVGVSGQSFISKVKRHHFSKLEIFLAVMSLLLLVALVVLIVVIEKENSKDTRTDERLKNTGRAIKSLARK